MGNKTWEHYKINFSKLISGHNVFLIKIWRSSSVETENVDSRMDMEIPKT